MGRDSAVEERRVGVVDDLVEDECSILQARRECVSVERPVADGQCRRLGDCVRSSTPL